MQTSEWPEAVHPKLIPANYQICSLDEKGKGGAYCIINSFFLFSFFKVKLHLQLIFLLLSKINKDQCSLCSLFGCWVKVPTAFKSSIFRPWKPTLCLSVLLSTPTPVLYVGESKQSSSLVVLDYFTKRFILFASSVIACLLHYVAAYDALACSKVCPYSQPTTLDLLYTPYYIHTGWSTVWSIITNNAL